RVGAACKHRAIAPQPAEAFAVLQRGGALEAGPIERQVAVAGQPVEKSRIAELRPVEAGHAAEFRARKGRTPAEFRSFETRIAEEKRRGEIGRRVEGRTDEPGQALERHAAHAQRGVEGRTREIEVGQRFPGKIERLVDGQSAQILDLAAAQRLLEPGKDRGRHHALPAAPAGGPAKDSANGPNAVMSTSTSWGP